MPHQEWTGPSATINYFPPYWTADRRYNNYAYLSTNAPPQGKTVYVVRPLLHSSYPANIDFRVAPSCNGASIQTGTDFAITNNPSMVLDARSDYFVSKDEWTARNWSSTGNWFWCQWKDSVEIDGGLDPRKRKERLLSVGYIVTVPIDTITLPVMWPYYLFTYKMNRGMSPR